MVVRFTIAALLLAITGIAGAATTVTVPQWACGPNDIVFRSGYQANEWIPHDASNGSGGAFPGSFTRTVHVAGLGNGTQSYYVRIPAGYTPTRPWPVLLALHGSAGTPANAALYAEGTRTSWNSTAESLAFIVVAPTASGSNGSWIVPPTAGANDYTLFETVLADVEASYNVDRTRRYLWGFSAGGHVAHDLILGNFDTQFTTSTIAAYAVSAGRLYSLACGGLSEVACGQMLTLTLRKIPLDIHLGLGDPLYGDPYFASQDAGRFVNAGWQSGQTLNYVTFNGGHAYTEAQTLQIGMYLCRYAVVP